MNIPSARPFHPTYPPFEEHMKYMPRLRSHVDIIIMANSNEMPSPPPSHMGKDLAPFLLPQGGGGGLLHLASAKKRHSPLSPLLFEYNWFMIVV